MIKRDRVIGCDKLDTLTCSELVNRCKRARPVHSIAKFASDLNHGPPHRIELGAVVDAFRRKHFISFKPLRGSSGKRGTNIRKSFFLHVGADKLAASHAADCTRLRLWSLPEMRRNRRMCAHIWACCKTLRSRLSSSQF